MTEMTAPVTAAPAGVRRRPVRWIGIVLLVVVVISVGIAGAVVARYDPLAEGSYSGTPNLSAPFRDVGESAFGTHTREATYVQGAALDVDFSIRNDGPWGVTIVSVPNVNYGLFHVTSVSRGVLHRCCVEVEPFSPFALAPGEERPVRLHGVIAGCALFAAESGSAWNTYTVGYRVLGLNRTKTIETRDAIEIRVPAGYVCTETPSPS